MKISAHVNITNPKKAGYPYMESIRSFANAFDEVIVVDGGSNDGSLKEIAKIDKVKIIKGKKWKKGFDWGVMGQNLQIGLEACTGDWACKFDIDYIFHEKHKDDLRRALEHAHLGAVKFTKLNFTLADRYFEKSIYPFMIQKKQFKHLGYGIAIEGDERQRYTYMYPIIKTYQKNGLWYGKSTMGTRFSESKVKIYCYDFTFMTKRQILSQRKHIEGSLSRFRKEKEKSPQALMKDFRDMMIHRERQCKTIIKPEDHPVFIRDKIKDLKPSQFGYNMFGWKNEKKP